MEAGYTGITAGPLFKAPEVRGIDNKLRKVFMSIALLLSVFAIGAVLGSAASAWIKSRPRKLSPEALERVNRIYAEAMAAAGQVEPENVLPKTSDLSFPEWQEQEQRRMAAEKARG
jgi:hypothetical protein